MKCIPVEEKFERKKCAAGQILNETKCAAGTTQFQMKCAAGQIF